MAKLPHTGLCGMRKERSSSFKTSQAVGFGFRTVPNCIVKFVRKIPKQPKLNLIRWPWAIIANSQILCYKRAKISHQSRETNTWQEHIH